jgi:ankyrin repeat protein
MTPLAKATKDGDINKISDLISSGGNINEREHKAGWSLLHYAVYYNQIDAVKFLSEKGANVNITDAQGYTPLLFALEYNNKDIINVLVDSGANMNILNNRGDTPLSYALHYRYFNILELLLEKGADVNFADARGNTLLALAVYHDNKDMVNFFLDQDADTEIPDKNGSTPLIQAALYGQTEIAKLLIEKGADIDAFDNRGSTALVVAIKNGQIETAKLLIEEGANVHVVDSYGYKASDYAKSTGSPITKIFKDKDIERRASLLKLLEDAEIKQISLKDTKTKQIPRDAYEIKQPECTQIPLQEVSPEERTRTMKIAILPVRFLPETDAINFTKMSKVASSALMGTAAGAGAGVYVTAGTPAAIFLAPIGAGVGLIVGTVSGVVSGDSKEEALEKKKMLEMENETKKVLLELKIQETMARYVQSAGKRETGHAFIVDKDAGPSSPGDKPDYTALVKQGIDTVLEIAVKKIGSAKIGGMGSDVYYFYMIVQAKLVHGTESSTQEFKYIIGPPRHYSEWVKAGADALQKEIDRAYEALAGEIVEFAFLYGYFESMDSPLFAGSPLKILVPKILNTRYILGSLSGLILEYPKPPDTPTFRFQPTSSSKYKEINTLQPTFKWESFPTAQDSVVDRKGIVNRISNVTYDLRIWSDNESERVLIYEKKGLKDNNHKIECSLKSHSYYLWTVRARFRLDDQYKATRWATLPRLFSIDPGYGIDLFAGSIPVVRRSYCPFMIGAE